MSFIEFIKIIYNHINIFSFDLLQSIFTISNLLNIVLMLGLAYFVILCVWISNNVFLTNIFNKIILKLKQIFINFFN